MALLVEQNHVKEGKGVMSIKGEESSNPIMSRFKFMLGRALVRYVDSSWLMAILVEQNQFKEGKGVTSIKGEESRNPIIRESVK